MNMSSPRLLIVSDDPRTRANVERVFSGRGYIVDAAPDAMRASELNESKDYDIAVVDEDCGSEDGTVLFQTLNDNNGRLDGILCAEEPTIDTVERALEAGMRHVTVKPVDPAEVVSLVEGLSQEAARPFEERFPHAATGMQVDEGMTKVARAMRCEWCSRRTHWVEPCVGLYFCCHDCLVNFRRSQAI